MGDREKKVVETTKQMEHKTVCLLLTVCMQYVEGL